MRGDLQNASPVQTESCWLTLSEVEYKETMPNVETLRPASVVVYASAKKPGITVGPGEIHRWAYPESVKIFRSEGVYFVMSAL